MNFRGLLPILLILATAQGGLAAQSLANTWLRGATPTVIQPIGSPPTSARNCACAPDPLLPNPACILCFCFENNTTSSEIVSELPTKACAGVTNLTPSKLNYVTGAVGDCACGKDILPGTNWVMCRCPGANPLRIPTTETYTAWPLSQDTTTKASQWPRCASKFALCSMANCTMSFVGAGASTVLLAECGCITATRTNGLGRMSMVDPTQILDKSLADQTSNQCPSYAQSQGCKLPNSTPICKAISQNTIYGGEYDLVSTFANTPSLGGFNKLCTTPGGLFAQCMTAACFERKAFDGSPVTCYCPVYRSNKYLIGSPLGVTPSCNPNGPYLASGVQVSGGK